MGPSTGASAGASRYGIKQCPKRTRRGCERCRSQHRKCDESKPSCQRCTSAGVECKYVTNLKFLDKNNQTVPKDVESQNPSLVLNSKYDELNFLDSHPPDTSQSIERTNSAPDPTTHMHGNTTQVLRSKSPGSGDTQPSIISYETCEYARRGWPLFGQTSLSSDEIELLSYFCTRVAPWLDVYDQAQTFRHHVTRLALDSPCNLDMIFRISSQFSGRLISKRRHGIGSLLLHAVCISPSRHQSPELALRLIASFALGRTLFFLETSLEDWESIFYGTGATTDFIPPSFTDTIQRQIWNSCILQISRLEMAYCLASSVAPTRISHLLQRTFNLPDSAEMGVGECENTLRSCVYCLKLLAESMSLCYPTVDSEDTSHSGYKAFSKPVDGTTMDCWKKILKDLIAWRKFLPLSMHPMVDTDGCDEPSPIIVFSSSAGISSNALYHLALYLLLNSVPEQMLASQFQDELRQVGVSLMPLWHLRRICAILSQCKPGHYSCWDPCLIAAFGLAARQITHPPHQTDILECLGQIRTAGWQVDALLARLRNEWGTSQASC